MYKRQDTNSARRKHQSPSRERRKGVEKSSSTPLQLDKKRQMIENSLEKRRRQKEEEERVEVPPPDYDYDQGEEKAEERKDKRSFWQKITGKKKEGDHKKEKSREK